MSTGRASIGTSKRLGAIAVLVILLLAGAWLTARWIAQGDEAQASLATPGPAATETQTAPSTSTPTDTSPSASATPSDEATPTPSASASSPSPSPTTVKPPQARVLFASNSSSLSSTAKADLNKVVAFVKASKTAFVVIQGHSDSKGSVAAKQRMAMARAHVVEDYLVVRGVPRARLSHTALSDTAPATGSTSAAAAENRRVDVIVKDVAR